jgi:Cytochrome c554 and c-prime
LSVYKALIGVIEFFAYLFSSVSVRREIVAGPVVFLLFVLSCTLPATAKAPRTQRGQRSEFENSVPTEIRVVESPWWPTSGSSKRNTYVGSAACAACHAKEYVSQTKTSMGRAAVKAGDSALLKAHPHLNVTQDGYRYELSTSNGTALFTVSDGNQTTTKNLLWAVGDGRFGQTYVYRQEGQFYESQLSYYVRDNSLETTTGHMAPRTLDTAAGGQTTPTMIHQCFGCHFTAATTNGQFHPDDAIPGVTCEACHGPGLNHVVLNTQGEAGDGDQLIMNPARLSPSDSVDFCGACHRTSIDAALQGLSKMGIATARLQPYRLQKSKCWGNGDARITCMACHDPHVQLVTDTKTYDSKCLACHAVKTHSTARTKRLAPACSVGTENCVTCHMAKITVPGTYSTFTDHWIRIVRAGAPYPE